MPNYAYVAKREDGRTVTGMLEATSQPLVMEALHRQGLLVVQIKEARVSSRSFRPSGGVGMDDLAVFSRQMATLVDAGISIVGGLDAVSEQLENKALREVVIRVREAVEGGANFTSAMAKYSGVFSQLFISMVKAGEASGHLAEVLDRLAIYLEKSAALQRKIRTACIYPGVVSLMAVIVTSLLMLKVIPAFKEVFRSVGAVLPLPTQILIAVSDFMAHHFLTGLLFGGLGLVLLRLFIRTPKGRLQFDRMLLRMPVVGMIVRKVAIAKFSRTLSTLVKSGVPILTALEIVSDTSGNRVVADAVLKVRTSIREGESISAPLAASRVFPPMVVRMIAVGEETGRLDDMLTKVAEFYEDQVDAAVAGLATAIEPMIIAVLGVIVGGIVLSIFLPIFKLTQVLGR